MYDDQWNPNLAQRLSQSILTRELDEQEDFSARIIESSNDGIFAFDCDLHFTIWNPAMEVLTGVTRSEAIARHAFDLFPVLVETGRDKLYNGALRGESLMGPEVAMNFPDRKTGLPQIRYVESRFSPLMNEFGQIAGGLAVVRDVTERHLAKEKIEQLNLELESQVRARTASLQFLAEAGLILSSTLERLATRRNVVSLATQYFNGGCVLRILTRPDDPDSPAEDTIEYSDAEKAKVVAEIHKKFFPYHPDSPMNPLHVIRHGKTAWMPDFPSTEVLRSSGQLTHPEFLELLTRLDLKSYICVPLIAHGRRLGALSLMSNSHRYTEADLHVAQDLGGRFAQAIDNAQLYEQARVSAG